jgi:hypothetical protein
MAMMKRLVMACACTVALTVASTTAMAQSTWTGAVSGTTVDSTTYGYWTNTGNWSGDAFSNQPSFLPVVNGQGYPVMMNDEFWISSNVGNAKMGSLTLSSGTIQHFDGSTTGIYKVGRIGASGSGTFTQTGGVFYYNKGELRIGENVAADTSSNGLYTISGGTFSTVGAVTGTTGGNVVLNRNQASANFQQAELRISGNAAVTLGQPVTVSQALRFGGGNGAANSAILSIIGSQATVNVWGLEMANATSTARNGLIQFSFEQSGPSLINLTGTIVGSAGVAANLTQGYLHIDYTGTQLTPGQTFNLMTAATGTIALNNSLFGLLTSDTANWQLQLTNGAATLQAVYVPEPSAAVLLAFGAGAGVFVIGKLNRARNARASRPQA